MQSKDTAKTSSANFNEFEAIETQQWQAAIEKFLKGKALESLDIEFEEDIRISPILRANDDYLSLSSTALPYPSSWSMCSYILVGNQHTIKSINHSILDALSRGSNALIIAVNKPLKSEELLQLFKGVEFAYIQVHFQLNLDPSIQSETLEHLAHHFSGQADRFSFDFNNTPQNSHLLETCQHLLGGCRPFCLQLSEASSDAMAQAFYTLSLYIDSCLEKGEILEDILRRVRFEYPSTLDYFGSIAGMRAIRILWNGLLIAYNPSENIPCFIHCNVRMNSTEAPYQNMIKASTQTMSAAVAGANSIWVEPSKGIENADDFSRRIALNVQHILQSESYLNKIADPAAGAFYIESLSKKIADKAWQQFCSL